MCFGLYEVEPDPTMAGCCLHSVMHRRLCTAGLGAELGPVEVGVFGSIRDYLRVRDWRQNVLYRSSAGYEGAQSLGSTF